MSLRGPYRAGQAEPPLYVPVLKGRQGEFDALEMMNPATRNRSYPLVEIVPEGDESHLQKPGDLMRLFGRMALKWEGGFMADGSHLTSQETGGSTGLRAVMDAARGPFKWAVPVVRLSDDAQVRADAAAAVRADGNGIAVRIVAAELVVSPGQVARCLRDLLREVGVAPEEVDVLLDPGYLPHSAAAKRASLQVDRVLNELTELGRYRCVTVTAGAFPSTLRDVQPWTLTEKPRNDAVLWAHLKALRPERLPVYGDYAINNPVRRRPLPWPPAPKLSYTVPSRWLILRGEGRSRRRNGQFYDVCRQISSHPQFSGPDLGEADQRIFDAPRFGPGNSTTWVAIATAHHADFVVHSLNETGLP